MRATGSSTSTFGTTGDFLFRSNDSGGSDGIGVFEVWVECPSTSSNDALVRVQNADQHIHGDDDFDKIVTGDSRYYWTSDFDNLIESIFVKGDGGAADINFTVTAV